MTIRQSPFAKNSPIFDLLFASIIPKFPLRNAHEFYGCAFHTIFTTSLTPFFIRSTSVATDYHHDFAALYAETQRNFGNLYYDVPTVEYTSISTVRTSTPTISCEPLRPSLA